MVYTVVSIQWYYWLIYRVVLFVAGSSKLKGFFYDTKDVFVFASSFISTWIQFFNDKSNKKNLHKLDIQLPTIQQLTMNFIMAIPATACKGT
jgi:hypothetical protein